MTAGDAGPGREKNVAALMALMKKPILNETVIIGLNRDLTLLNALNSLFKSR